MGVANTFCISNATVNIGDDSVGLRVGYRFGASPATNCVLVMQGETPKVNIVVSSDKKACKFDNGSTLRFEIPKKNLHLDFAHQLWYSIAIRLNRRLAFA